MSVPNKFQEVLGFEEEFIEFHIDPLHGPIGITEEERKLVTSKYFKRLKYIRQLGLVHHFYHSATHTRYEHSLGVLHTTWSMFKRIFSNFNIENHHYYVKPEILDILNNLANPKIIRALRIASLCHDLGHGPFSHTFEIISEELCPNFRDHDKITYDIIESNEIGIAKDIHPLVLSIVNPRKKSLQGKKFGELQFFLHDIVAGHIGSDRIDYLLRDTYMTGLGHRFGLIHLLDAITAIYDPNKNRLFLSVEASEKDAVFYFLTTRFYHFQLLANYKDNVKLETELKNRFNVYIQAKRNKEDISDVIAEFQKKTDDEVKSTLSDYASAKLVMLAKWTLNEIAISRARFFIYRFSYDKRVRCSYADAIRNYVRDTIASSSNLVFSFNVQKGRIPVIPVTLSSYKRVRPPEKAGGKISIQHLNSLLHEFSPLLFGLARTYLENTMITIFGEAKDPDLEDKLGNSPKFLFHNQVIVETLQECSNKIEQSKKKIKHCNRLDFLILFVEAMRRTTKKVAVWKDDRIIILYRFRYLQSLIRKVQSLVFSKNAKHPYEYNEQSNFYNPGRKDDDFVFHETLFNDLFLLELFSILEIEDYNDKRTPEETPNEIHYYPTYKFTFKLSYLKEIIREYEKFPPYCNLLSKIQDAMNRV